MSGLNDAFDTVEAVGEVVPEKNKLHLKKPTGDDIDKDYEYTRGNLYSLIDKGQEAVNGALDLAMSSDHPRAYEVAGQLIKNVGDNADKLMDLQKKLEEVQGGGSAKNLPGNVTNNTMFVGSTAELAKFLKKQKDK